MASELTRYAAANAVARSLLGRLLGRDGLESLAGYPSAGAVVDALEHTSYAPVLVQGVRADRALPARVARVGRALLRWLRDPEEGFLRLFLLHHEVDNLKVLLRGIAARMPADAIRPLLAPLDGIATLDLSSLAASRGVPDLVDRLVRTPYGPALRHALSHWRASGVFALEVAVELDFYDRLWTATTTLRRRDREAARDLLGVLFDVLNISWIVRYREAYGLSPEETLAYTLREGRWLTASRRRTLAGLARSPWETALERTPYASAFTPDGGFEVPAVALTRMVAQAVQAACGGYPFHVAVPLACVMAYDIEVRDLQRILAAKSVGARGAGDMGEITSIRH